MPDWPRITFDPSIMGGQACIRGMRLPVTVIVRCLASGMTTEIRDVYSEIKDADIAESLRYTAQPHSGERLMNWRGTLAV